MESDLHGVGKVRGARGCGCHMRWGESVDGRQNYTCDHLAVPPSSLFEERGTGPAMAQLVGLGQEFICYMSLWKAWEGFEEDRLAFAFQKDSSNPVVLNWG